MERSNTSLFGLIGKKLRAELADAIDQPLPERWIDLIRRLRERERQKPSDSPAEPARQANQK